MNRRKVLKILGYVGFSLLSLLMSFYFTFPSQVLGQRIALQVSKATHGQWSVTFKDISLYWFTGIEAEGVHLTKQNPAGAPLEVDLDSLRARLQLLPLIFLAKPTIAADIQMGEGNLAARVQRLSNGDLNIGLEIEDWNVASPPMLSKMAGLPIAGVITGNADVKWMNDPTKSTGQAKFTFKKTAMGPGQVAGFTLPSIEFGDIDLALELKEGQMRVSSFKQQNAQLQARISGMTTVRPQFGNSSLEACVLLKADPELLNKNPNLRTAAELAEIRLKKDGDGFLQMPLTGTISNPKLRNGMCRKG